MSNVLLNSVSGSLSDLRNRIKEVGVGGVVGDTLVQNEMELEEWYQKILAQKGVLSEEDKTRLTDSLTSAKKSILQSDAKRDKKRMLIVVGISILVIAGIIFFVYKKRKQ